MVAVPAAGFLVPLLVLLVCQVLSVSTAERSYEGQVRGPVPGWAAPPLAGGRARGAGRAGLASRARDGGGQRAPLRQGWDLALMREPASQVGLF